jgi:two-component system sensor histidine kinase UhpB
VLNVTIYRIVQESLTNVLRHARASSVRIALLAGGDGLLLTVQDDGQGMDLAASSRRGLGLLGAAERAAAAGGELRVHGAPGTGVRIELRLPLPASPGSMREAA